MKYFDMGDLAGMAKVGVKVFENGTWAFDV